eukprot:tig00021621_g22974.t1
MQRPTAASAAPTGTDRLDRLVEQARAQHQGAHSHAHGTRNELEAVVRNRRYRRMKELVAGGEYFSREAMRLREPHLYHQYIGQYDEGGPQPFPADMRLYERLLHDYDDAEAEERRKSEARRDSKMQGGAAARAARKSSARRAAAEAAEDEDEDLCEEDGDGDEEMSAAPPAGPARGPPPEPARVPQQQPQEPGERKPARPPAPRVRGTAPARAGGVARPAGAPPAPFRFQNEDGEEAAPPAAARTPQKPAPPKGMGMPARISFSGAGSLPPAGPGQGARQPAAMAPEGARAPRWARSPA